jgi:hypothetical protein
MGNQGTPDMGNSGPFRGELGSLLTFIGAELVAARWKQWRGINQNLLFRPLAGQGQAGHQLLRDVLNHGLHADVRADHRCENANGPSDRWGSIRPTCCSARARRAVASPLDQSNFLQWFAIDARNHPGNEPAPETHFNYRYDRLILNENPRPHAMQDKLCNISPDGDKITIAVREKSGAAQEITLMMRARWR